MVTALHVVREVVLHVVAEIVEPELVVRTVGDVARVGDLALGIVEIVLDHADRHAEEPIDPPHPFGVASGEVVVHGDDMDPFAGEGVQIGRQRGHQRLAFAGLHLGDLAAMEDHPADQLDVEMAHVQRAAAGFADHGERVGQQVVERLALLQALTEFRSLGAQLFVRELLDGRLPGVDRDHDRRKALQLTLVLRADDFREEFVDDHAGELRSGYQMIVRDPPAAVNQPTVLNPALCRRIARKPRPRPWLDYC